MGRFRIVALLLAITVIAACKPERSGSADSTLGNGAYVLLQGQKLTERDVAREMPDEYKALRRSFDAQIQQRLENLAINRMLELEAKEQGLHPNELLDKLTSDTAPVSEEEVRRQFDEFRAQGQLQDDSYESIRGEIVRFIENERRRNKINEVIGELQRKYRYDVPRQRVEVGNAPTRGNANAPVTIVEFSDYECPFCQRFQATSQRIQERYPNEVRIVFKHFPLDFHPRAMTAHMASYCIQQQSEELFWDYFDAIFAPNRGSEIFETENLLALGAQIGADRTKLEQCLNSPAARSAIERDLAQGQSLGVTGTPAFFVNGRFLSGAQPFDEFVSLIEAEL